MQRRGRLNNGFRGTETLHLARRVTRNPTMEGAAVLRRRESNGGRCSVSAVEKSTNRNAINLAVDSDSDLRPPTFSTSVFAHFKNVPLPLSSDRLLQRAKDHSPRVPIGRCPAAARRLFRRTSHPRRRVTRWHPGVPRGIRIATPFEWNSLWSQANGDHQAGPRAL